MASSSWSLICECPRAPKIRRARCKPIADWLTPNAAISTNIAAINAAVPTNAQLVTHVKNLSRQNNALIRIVLGLLDSTDGT